MVMKSHETIRKSPIYETVFVIIGAYFAYALAHLDFFVLSGDVAIFFYGVVMSHYNKYNLSLESFKSIGLSFNLMMQVSEAVCFIYIGLSFEDAIRGHIENLKYAIVILFLLLLCRMIIVAIIALINRNQINFRISGGEWCGVVSSGLVKGPLAYIFMDVLIPNNPDCIDVFNPEHYKVAYPLFVIQICVVGSLFLLQPLNHLVYVCSVPEKLNEGDDVEVKIDRERELKEKLLSDDWIVEKDRPRVFKYMDEFLLKPLLIRDYHKRKIQINKMKNLYDDLAAKYDHGIHLEHDAHEKYHSTMHDGRHHSHHNQDHVHPSEAKPSFDQLDDETKKRKTFWREVRLTYASVKSKAVNSEIIPMEVPIDETTSASNVPKQEDLPETPVFDSMIGKSEPQA